MAPKNNLRDDETTPKKEHYMGKLVASEFFSVAGMMSADN